MESDEELMEAVARGDEAALASLIERWAAPLHAYLARRVGSRDDADELAQDLWVRVARSAGTFDANRRFRPWVFGVAANLARDLFRRRQVRQRVRLEAASAAPPAYHPTTVENLDLRQRLDRLPDRFRDVLMLRYFHDLGESEMAEALGVPRGTIKSRLHGAIRELKRGYGDPT